MKEEAGEVIRAVGAWVLVFKKAVNERGEGEGALVCKEFSSLCLCGRRARGGGRCDKRQEVGSGQARALSSIYIFDMESHIQELANRQAKK